MTTQDEGLTGLSTHILQDAREQAESLIEEANAWADDFLKRANEEVGAKQARVHAEGEREAVAIKRQILSSARMEAKRILLARREDLIARAMLLAKQRLSEPLPPIEKQVILRGLIIEAALALGGGNLEVRVNAADRVLISEALLRNTAHRVEENGLEVRLRFSDEPMPILGGVIISKGDGRVLFDNSFDARLERMGDSLRRQIWEILTKERAEQPGPSQIRPAA